MNNFTNVRSTNLNISILLSSSLAGITPALALTNPSSLSYDSSPSYKTQSIVPTESFRSYEMNIEVNNYSNKSFESEMTSIYSELLDNQVHLGNEFSDVLVDNLRSLYVY